MVVQVVQLMTDRPEDAAHQLPDAVDVAVKNLTILWGFMDSRQLKA